MSSLYNLEPQPTAKVALHTTSGDILLELFAKQTPLTSRNFLQLCLDGYYDGTVFHRLVPGFIIQGGDPTGTGSGGESSYNGGKPFEDEFHSRLKFNRRGLLGMANSGDRDDNGSQFFLTLGKTEELTGRNTMFGRVVGDTIFNVVKMGEADLTDIEGSDRPMYPTRILSTEILVNHFEDMVKRLRATKLSEPAIGAERKKSRKKAAKQLLSFGGDEEGDVTPVRATKSNPLLADVEPSSLRTQPKRPAPDSKLESERPAKRRSPPAQTSARTVSKRVISAPSAPPGGRATSSSPSTSRSPSPASHNKAALEQANAQIESLKSSLRRKVPKVAFTETHKKSALELMIPTTATRGRKRKGGGAPINSGNLSREEQHTLDEFNAFRKKLEEASVDGPPGNSKIAKVDQSNEEAVDESKSSSKEESSTAQNLPDTEEEANLCDLHFIANCESCTRWEDRLAATDAVVEDNEEEGLLSHKLSFAKDRLGKSLEWKRQNEKELVVIDPREKERDLKVSNHRRKEKGHHKEHDSHRNDHGYGRGKEK